MGLVVVCWLSILGAVNTAGEVKGGRMGRESDACFVLNVVYSEP